MISVIKLSLSELNQLAEGKSLDVTERIKLTLTDEAKQLVKREGVYELLASQLVCMALGNTIEMGGVTLGLNDSAKEIVNTTSDRNIYLTVTDITNLVAGKVLNPCNVNILMTDPAKRMYEKIREVVIYDVFIPSLLQGESRRIDNVDITFSKGALKALKTNLKPRPITLLTQHLYDLMQGLTLEINGVKINLTKNAIEGENMNLLEISERQFADMLKGKKVQKKGDVQIELNTTTRQMLNKLLSKGETMTRISLSNSDFKLLVAGKVVSIGDVEICLQDIGFGKMKVIIDTVKNNITFEMEFKLRGITIHRMCTDNMPQNGQVIQIRGNCYTINGMDRDMNKQTCVVHLLDNEYTP